MTSANRSSAKSPALNVGGLISHLRTLPADLPVFFVMFDDGYNINAVRAEDVHVSRLENDTGKEFSCVVIGEEWLG